MSTILKALQRLEDEKSATTERSLDEQIVARRPPPAPERRGRKIAVVAIGGLAVAASAFWFWNTREESGTQLAMDSQTPATAPTQEATFEKPRRRSSARPAPGADVQPESSQVEVSPIIEVVKRLDVPTAGSATPAALPNRAEQAPKAGSERPSRRRGRRNADTRVADGAEQQEPARQRSTQKRFAKKQPADTKPLETEVSEQSVPVKPASPSPAVVETVEVVREPAPALPAAVASQPALAAVSAPAPAAVSEPEPKFVQRANVPTLLVEKTIWHPDADRRIAVVKLIDTEDVLRLKEGDAVGPLVIKAIKPSSVLFDHDDIEIQLNVGG